MIFENGNGGVLDVDRAFHRSIGGHGWVLGMTGSGKTRFCMAEIKWVLEKRPEDNVIVVDTDGGYASFARGYGGDAAVRSIEASQISCLLAENEETRAPQTGGTSGDRRSDTWSRIIVYDMSEYAAACGSIEHLAHPMLSLLASMFANICDRRRRLGKRGITWVYVDEVAPLAAGHDACEAYDLLVGQAHRLGIVMTSVCGHPGLILDSERGRLMLAGAEQAVLFRQPVSILDELASLFEVPGRMRDIGGATVGQGLLVGHGIAFRFSEYAPYRRGVRGQDTPGGGMR